MMRRIALILTVTTLVLGVAQGAMAAPKKGDPPCSVSQSSVSAGQEFSISVTGLPTGTAINLWTTNANGTIGQPLGSTPDGTFNLVESSSVAGTNSYAFSGPVKNNMTVFSTCSVQVG